MKKHFWKLVFLLTPFAGLRAQDFPMTDLPSSEWDKSGIWHEVEDLLIYPFGTNAMELRSGSGVVYATANENQAAKLTSRRTLGDFKLQFEFLQSNEAQAELVLGESLNINLNNSAANKAKLMGSLQNGDAKPLRPAQNVAKQSGLWQKAELIYAAPKGNKRAVLEKLTINGITLFENYVVPSISAGQRPISFNLSRGTLALRNIKYSNYSNGQPVSLSNFKYELQETNGWGQTFEVKETPPVFGKTNSLTHEIQNDYQEFILTYTGDIKINKAGLYAFRIDYQGVCEFLIDGKEVVGSPEYIYRVPSTGLVELTAGTHTFEYKYQRIWWPPGFGLFVSGADFRPYALHPPKTLPAPENVGGIYENVTRKKARLIRSFMNFKDEKRTKVISVGTSNGLHYSFDLDAGGLLYAWKGDFADVTEMWHERGEPQLIEPLGQKIVLSGKSAFYSDDEDELVLEEYFLDNAGLPTYLHSLNGVSVSIKLEPVAKGLLISISANEKSINYTLAEAQSIQKISPTLYKTDEYYIQLDEAADLTITEENGLQRLFGKPNEIKSYTLIW